MQDARETGMESQAEEQRAENGWFLLCAVVEVHGICGSTIETVIILLKK